MHFAFEVDNFHTVDCAVIYYLPGVIIQVYPRPCPGPCNHATAAELCVCRPPDAAGLASSSPTSQSAQTLPLVTTPALTSHQPDTGICRS